MSFIWHNVVSSSWFCCHEVAHLCKQAFLDHFRIFELRTTSHDALTSYSRKEGEGVGSLGGGKQACAQTASVQMTRSTDPEAVPNQHQVAQPIRGGEQGPFNASEP